MTGPRIVQRPGTPDTWTPPPQWTVDALCAEVDGDLFFPEKGANNRAAKAICAGCPVTAECLQYALDTDQHFGIWGGLSEWGRRKLKPRPTLPASRDCPGCGATFTPAVHNQEWCSKACWQRSRKVAA